MKPDHTTYAGELFGDGRDVDALVTVDGEYLDHRISCQLHNHSPTGFAWGYAGSGPAQLALGILYDFLEDDPDRADRAMHHYQDFKFAVIARLAENSPWTLTGQFIRAQLEDLERARPFVPFNLEAPSDE